MSDETMMWDEVADIGALLHELDDEAAQHPRQGISRLIPTKTGFLDHLIHNQDIRRPTGQPRTRPPNPPRRQRPVPSSRPPPVG